jgi:hypothetical protein
MGQIGHEAVGGRRLFGVLVIGVPVAAVLIVVVLAALYALSSIVVPVLLGLLNHASPNS